MSSLISSSSLLQSRMSGFGICVFDWTYRAREKAVMDKSKRELMNKASGGRAEKRTKIEVQERRSISKSLSSNHLSAIRLMNK